MLIIVISIALSFDDHVSIYQYFSILKTTWAINSVNVDPVTTWEGFRKYLFLGFVNLPFTITASFFRISCAILVTTYLNQYGFVSIGAFWIANLIISVKTLANSSLSEANDNSTWLMSFIGLFVPAYFFPKYTTKSCEKRTFLVKQKTIYRQQCIASLICYVPSLLTCWVQVNFPCGYVYQKDGGITAIDNFEFNVIIAMVIMEGIISTALSFFPES